jgi:2-oxoglutarate dehydrogenase E2 component (dihydrolipoamide succinyltransferase)
MPKMGESVSEATIITWNKNIGDMVELDETIIEIATDKVDSEVPSTHEGKLIEQLYSVDDIVKVGKPFAIIETSADEAEVPVIKSNSDTLELKEKKEKLEKTEDTTKVIKNTDSRFYSPLVKSMANEEGIDMDELENITGSGKDGRVTKSDMILHIEKRKSNRSNIEQSSTTTETTSKVNDVSRQEEKNRDFI